LGPESEILTKINDVVDYFTSSKPQQADSPVRYPGEATLQRRQEQLKNGVIISDEIWQTIIHL
jgi:3-dehydro-L-gulonate 2-dehydrogenase